MRPLRLPLRHQYTLAYLLAEIALVAIALAALRIAAGEPRTALELRTGLFCLSLVASCGAAGGPCLRMAIGLVAGGVFAVASIPMLVVLMTAAAR